MISFYDFIFIIERNILSKDGGFYSMDLIPLLHHSFRLIGYVPRILNAVFTTIVFVKIIRNHSTSRLL